MKIQITNRRTISTNRRGVAPLEFVMVLPFLVILAGIIFTMARASLVKSEAIMQARHEAWHNRYGHGAGGTLPVSSGSSEAEKLAGLTRGPAFSGLQSGSGSGSGKVQFLALPNKYFFFSSISSTAHHEVFSMPWDHESIPFESHPPLGLDSRVTVYTFREDTLGSLADHLHLFGNLMKLVTPPSSAAESWSKVQKALTTVGNKIEELNREIRQLEDELRELRDRLNAAVDKAVIQELRRQIDRVERILQKLRDSRDHLLKGRDLAPH